MAIDYKKLWLGSYKDRHRNNMMPYLASSIIIGSSYNFGFAPSVIDWGCGQGHSYEAFRVCDIHAVALVDISETQYEGPKHLFVEGSVLDARLGHTAEFGYCSDVLEHLEEEDIDKALHTMFLHADCGVFVNVGTEKDAWRDSDGYHELHTTVKPATWWGDKLKEYGRISMAGAVIPVNNSFFFVECKNWRT